MILRLAVAELRHRPGRVLFLLFGYALGVAVMVTLLSVGEAMLFQSRDRALVGGGDLVVVPAGISAEMLRTGGVESLFLGIDHARFLQRNVLEGPRGRQRYGIRAASPMLENRAVEVLAGGQVYRATGTGVIPTRAAAAGAAVELLAGTWTDAPADRRWASPTPEELYDGIDHFHLPAGAAANDSTWAEWHYFNAILAPDRWIYLTLLVGGQVGQPGRWGGQLLLTVREPDGTHRSLRRNVADTAVVFDTSSAHVRLGRVASVRQENGVYRVVAAVDGHRIDLAVAPAPHRYFPPTDLGGSALVSGYTVPALYARATGTVCLPRCETVRAVQAYHDHNWGVWRDVSWEWGTASSDSLSLLYGVVRGENTASEGLFIYLADDLGPRALYRAPAMQTLEWQTVRVNGATVRVPRRLRFADARQGLETTIDVEAAHVTDTNRPARRYFVQMRGTAEVRERGGGVHRLPGFFETYVD